MLAEAGFPPAQRFGSDPDDIDAQGLGSAPDSWEQLQLDIPGLKPIIKLRGRMGAVVRDEGGAKVADVAAYLDMCQQMHDNFGKTVDQIRDSLHTMREGCGGDDPANAVQAWEAGLEADVDNHPATPDPPRWRTPGADCVRAGRNSDLGRSSERMAHAADG